MYIDLFKGKGWNVAHNPSIINMTNTNYFDTIE
jgi:hypothetical protein